MCQSHTGRLTGLWFLPNPAFGLNTNDDDDDDIYIYYKMTWFLVDINTHWGQLNLNLKRRSAILLQVSRFCNILKFEHTLQNFRSSELYLQFDVLWCTEWCCGRSWWTCRIMWRSLDGKYCDVYWPSHFIGMRNFGNQSRRNLTLCVPCIICDVLMTNEMHNSYNQFYSTVFFVYSTRFERI